MDTLTDQMTAASCCPMHKGWHVEPGLNDGWNYTPPALILGQKFKVNVKRAEFTSQAST
jgi:hypothetical protein